MHTALCTETGSKSVKKKPIYSQCLLWNCVLVYSVTRLFVEETQPKSGHWSCAQCIRGRQLTPLATSPQMSLHRKWRHRRHCPVVASLARCWQVFLNLYMHVIAITRCSTQVNTTAYGISGRLATNLEYSRYRYSIARIYRTARTGGRGLHGAVADLVMKMKGQKTEIIKVCYQTRRL